MYEDVTYEKIRNRMLARVEDNLDKREGSLIWDTHSPTAVELQILYIELDTILREIYGDTASREFLILRCKERGIIPYPQTHAVLKGVFTPENIDVSGRRFNIGTVNYLVTEKIADGEYRVQCETAGITGNQYLGSMTPVTYISGLETAELTEVLVPGEEEEETEELRQRYFDSFAERAFGGNVRDYLEKTNAIAGVGRTKVTRVWNSGIAPAAMIPPERVSAWYEETAAALDGEVKNWLDLVYHAAAAKKLTTGGTVLLTIIDAAFNAASDGLLQTVQNTMDPEESAGEGDGLAPIGHVVSVQSAKEIAVTVKAELTFDTGYGWDNLQGMIDEAVSGYLLELRKAWADAAFLVVRLSQIESRLLAVPGIVDIRHTSLNGAEDNLILGAYEIPVFGRSECA